MEMEEKQRVGRLVYALVCDIRDAGNHGVNHAEECECHDIERCDSWLARKYRERVQRADEAQEELFSILGIPDDME